MEQAKKSKAKGRKIGRHRDRSRSAKMYTQSRRWEINKAKKAKRHIRRMTRKAIHRIEWEISLHRTTLQAQADKLVELRHVLSQNN